MLEAPSNVNSLSANFIFKGKCPITKGLVWCTSSSVRLLIGQTQVKILPSTQKNIGDFGPVTLSDAS